MRNDRFSSKLSSVYSIPSWKYLENISKEDFPTFPLQRKRKWWWWLEAPSSGASLGSQIMDAPLIDMMILTYTYQPTYLIQFRGCTWITFRKSWVPDTHGTHINKAPDHALVWANMVLCKSLQLFVKKQHLLNTQRSWKSLRGPYFSNVSIFLTTFSAPIESNSWLKRHLEQNAIFGCRPRAAARP